MYPKQLGIIADDLTGAMDSSSIYPHLGLSTILEIGSNATADCDVAVINTDSRSDPPEVAAAKVCAASKKLYGRFIFKKIDSTLRGNVNAEVLAISQQIGSSKIIIAPAFPSLGRTTVDGFLLVDGVKVSDSEFGQIQIDPVTESHIPSMLGPDISPMHVGLINTSYLKSSTSVLFNKIQNSIEDILVFDATSQAHLKAICKAASLSKGQWLLCGSGGLARESHHLLPNKLSKKRIVPTFSNDNLLIIVGSNNTRSREQLKMVRNNISVNIINLETENLYRNGGYHEETDRLLCAAGKLAKGPIIISSTFSQYIPDVHETISRILAIFTRKFLKQKDFDGLFITGGDTAMAICNELSVSAIKLHGEMDIGIPFGEMVSGPAHGLTIITKAGGFGKNDAILKVLQAGT